MSVVSKLQFNNASGSSHSWLSKQPQLVQSSKLVVANLSCTELGTAQPQLVTFFISLACHSCKFVNAMPVIRQCLLSQAQQLLLNQAQQSSLLVTIDHRVSAAFQIYSLRLRPVINVQRVHFLCRFAETFFFTGTVYHFTFLLEH